MILISNGTRQLFLRVAIEDSGLRIQRCFSQRRIGFEDIVTVRNINNHINHGGKRLRGSRYMIVFCDSSVLHITRLISRYLELGERIEDYYSKWLSPKCQRRIDDFQVVSFGEVYLTKGGMCIRQFSFAFRDIQSAYIDGNDNSLRVELLTGRRVSIGLNQIDNLHTFVRVCVECGINITGVE